MIRALATLVVAGMLQPVAWADEAHDLRQLTEAAVAAGDIDGALAAIAASDEVPGAQVLRAHVLHAAGEIRTAETVLTVVLAGTPDDPEALALWGLVLVDLGRGDEAEGVFDRAMDVARGDRDRAVVWLHRGVLHADRGDRAAARDAWERAMALATSANDAGLMAEARVQLSTLSEERDVVGQVLQLLGEGQVGLADARTQRTGRTLRERVQLDVARAMVDRAQGALVRASERLVAAIDRARAAGLVREAVAGQVELATVLRLRGQLDAAARVLDLAAADVAGSSHRVRRVDVGLGRARLALERGDVDAAEAALVDVRRLLTVAPTVAPAIDEIAAQIAVQRGDLVAADASWASAEAGWASTQRPADVARVALAKLRGTIRLSREGDPEPARRLLAALHDAAGEARVLLAMGTGHAEAARPGEALTLLTAAEREATRSGRPDLAAEARDLLVAVQRALGDEGAPDDAAVRHTRMLQAREAYAEGLAAFEVGHWTAAIGPFRLARTTFDALGMDAERALATKALAWAEYQAVLGGHKASSDWSDVVALAESSGDGELVARARVHAALAQEAATRGAAKAPGALRAAADAAEAQGLPVLAARCRLALSKAELPFDERLAEAEAALRLDPIDLGPWAMYEVAFAAYARDDADAVDRARALAMRGLSAAEGDARDALSDFLSQIDAPGP